MPTSVGPKTYGKDNLVFGYDTGDTKNSYKGEPTENLVDAFPDTSLPSGFNISYEFSASIHDTPVSNHEFSGKKWMKFTKTSATNGRVMFTNGSFTSGSQYTWSCYVYCNDSRLTSLYHNSDNVAYSQRVSFKQYDFNKLGTVQRLYGTWNQLQNGGSVFGMRAGSTNPLSSSFFMTGLQVEEKGHMTPVVNGTRSANSGSILDLANNSTVDVTNVSFDSDAQPDWDGSTDYITTGTPSDFRMGSGSFTLEAVAKQDITSAHVLLEARGSSLTGYLWTVNYGNVGGMSIFYNDNTGGQNIHYQTGDYDITSTQDYYHLVARVDRASNKVAFFINGEQAGNAVDLQHTGSISPTGGDYYHIGWDKGGVPWNGQIPIFKHYNRALTSEEVKANFNAIKGRFNI